MVAGDISRQESVSQSFNQVSVEFMEVVLLALYSSCTGVFLGFEMFQKSPDNLSHKILLSVGFEKENKTGATWDYSDRHCIAMTTRLGDRLFGRPGSPANLRREAASPEHKSLDCFLKFHIMTTCLALFVDGST